jgi:hypothetical protein
MAALIFLLLNLGASLFKSKSRLEAENAALRQQLMLRRRPQHRVPLGGRSVRRDMRRMTIGALELSAIDDDEADTKYIYEEVFGSQIYHHPQMRVPSNPTIMDVGANIGLFSIWAHHRYRPQAIYCYEASPRTFACLNDNIQRLIRSDITTVSAYKLCHREQARPEARAAPVHQGVRD